MDKKYLNKYLGLRTRIETADLRKEFANKRDTLFQMIAISTGLCEDKKACIKHCPIDQKVCPYYKK